jgi:competence protein ComGC
MIPHTTPKRRDAFTVTELVVVILIVLLLVGLLVPALHHVRVAAARTSDL